MCLKIYRENIFVIMESRQILVGVIDVANNIPIGIILWKSGLKHILKSKLARPKRCLLLKKRCGV